jgi:peptidoglycan/xylan/chitin deacetylase (PgdA/CDA1 family)
MFPNGAMKALTLSYDDGVEQDRRLVALFHKYQVKATFNINSGIQSNANSWVNNGTCIKRMNRAGLPELYAGHEIAVHSLTHPHLELCDEDTVRNELDEDKRALEALFQTPVCGMAYPYGTFNELVVRVARECGLRYARGVASTHSFDLPENLMAYQPTCHHADEALMELAEAFIALRPDKPQVFYLWGHSYEFDVDHNWHIMEDFCQLIAGRADIFYGTNAQTLLGDTRSLPFDKLRNRRSKRPA